ncbi:cell envelope biogenesis protein TolA [Reyranella sp.]|uniref:cell envelope biogenesis protein TolA n=1 Tax=Reyranella sp. TaxID=1929291 RepID=UPI003BAA76AF
MARKLKAFTTSAGFFDLAVSAPSMKAALEAWGAGANLFNQGFAQQTDDPAIVKATMAQPGLVLRRPVGTDQPFREEAEASEAPFEGRAAKTPGPAQRKPARPQRKPVAEQPPNRKEERAAARAFERERARRERQERQEAADRRTEAARRERALAAATAGLEKAEARHEALVAEIEKARAALDAKADREAGRWRRERESLEEALRAARVPRHLRAV